MSNAPYGLKVNRLTAPLAVPREALEFSWLLPDDLAQTSWEIEVMTESGAPIWSSGTITDRESFGIPYVGPHLDARTGYQWRVRVGLDTGTVSERSQAATFETAPSDDDWRAQWISSPGSGSKSDTASLYLRKDIALTSPVVRARAYTTALGWYRLFVNSTDVTGDALVPRWTPFHDYVEYQTFDVTEEFRAGDNVIGMVVAEGRFRGHQGVFARARTYGDRLAAFAQVVIDLEDGTQVTLGTDDTWRSVSGRSSTADPMMGERADLRIPEMGWLMAPAPSQSPAVEIVAERRELQPEETERVEGVTRLSGTVTRTPAGAQLIDFGQNFAGVARIRLSGPVGSTVKLLYSEVLTPAGELATGYLGVGDKKEWFQRDEVVLADAPITYQAALTIHGFRYVSVVGPADVIADEQVEGVAISTDLEWIREFSSSDESLNKLWENVAWSLRSNFTDTPTDCPTRERSGWTGDIQVFSAAASQLVDADSYLRRYLRNVSFEQGVDGRIPPFIPAEDTPGRKRNALRFASTSAGWGDVAVLLPWTLYQHYGDEEVLRRQFDSACSWVDQLARRARSRTGLRRRFGKRTGPLEKFIVDTGYHWGEWLRPGDTFSSEIPGNFTGKRASVATAYLAHSARILAKTAGVLGQLEDEAKYTELANNSAAAWRAAYVNADGSRIGDDKQDDYVRGLAFELLKPEQRAAAGARLAELVEQAGFHLATGFLSTPMLLETLVEAGYSAHAFRILYQDTAPSWMGQIALGATTVWETWEGYKKDGEPSASHNHYAFGAVVQFLHERVAGLAPAGPAYSRIRIAPIVGFGPTSARTSVITPYGRAAVSWTIEGDEVVLEAVVPQGCSAEVEIGAFTAELVGGEHSLRLPVPASANIVGSEVR